MTGETVVSNGSRTRGKLILALGLVALVPLLVLTCWLYAWTPAPNPSWPVALLAAAGLAAGAGALVVWSVVRSLGAAGAPPSAAELSAPGGTARVPAEVESLMHAFSRMLTTVEQQASDIHRYAIRLDSAYKEIETSNARLKEFSFKDEVTGLYNRRFFSIRLEEEVSRYRRFNHPVSVVLLDLDGFKQIKDELGNAAGDETLRGMAEILLKHSRGINVLCRYGGDEFAVLLVETSKGGARLYADRIRYVLPTYGFAHGRHVTASFGIASLPEDVAPTPEALIRAADEALYAAKRAGKNRVSVYEDIRAPLAGEDVTQERR
jgi:diguanylate cyclase (GGDEF)-like protein